MKKIFIIAPLLPLLTSMGVATDLNSVALDSLILGERTLIYELLEKNSIKKICQSNVLGNEAASVIFHYEVFKKRKDYAPYSYYKTTYHVLYRADIYLNSLVHYKGGVGN